MTILMIALLTSVMVAGFLWAAMRRLQSKETIMSRLESISGTNIISKENEAKKKFENERESLISLDDSFQDKLTRSLYLGGKRTKKDVQIFKAMRIIPILIPTALILIQLSGGSVTQVAILQSLSAGLVSYLLIISSLNTLKKKRQNEIIRGMPQLFDLLVIALESGVNFSAALPRVLKELDPFNALTQEFDQMQHEFLAGLSFVETCDRLAKRCEVQDLSVIMNSLIESEQLGSSLSNVLRVQSHELRDKLRQRIRERAHRLPVKLLFPMMILFSTMFVITLGPISYELIINMKKFTGTEEQKNARKTYLDETRDDTVSQKKRAKRS